LPDPSQIPDLLRERDELRAQVATAKAVQHSQAEQCATLRATVARLEADNADLCIALEETAASFESMAKLRREAEADNARLREALAGALPFLETEWEERVSSSHTDEADVEEISNALDAARAALAGGKS